MSDNDKSRESLAAVTDDSVLREAAFRLRQRFYREHGKPFLFGSFEFIFHSGKFQWVEECPRSRRYLNRPKKAPVTLVNEIGVQE